MPRTTATVHLVAWKPLRRGRLIGLADILVEVEGVEILVQGWRAELDRAGHPLTGISSPCIALPPGIGQAVADLVAEAAGPMPDRANTAVKGISRAE